MAGRTAAAAGCWPSKECSAPSPSGVLFCRLFLTFAERQNRHGNKWLDTHRLPPGWPAGPAGAEQEENQLLRRNASAVGLHHATFARRPARSFKSILRGGPGRPFRPRVAPRRREMDLCSISGKIRRAAACSPHARRKRRQARRRPRKDTGPAQRLAPEPPHGSAGVVPHARTPACGHARQGAAREMSGAGRGIAGTGSAGPSWLTLTILTPATGRSRMSV